MHLLSQTVPNHILHGEAVQVKKGRPILITVIAILQIIPILLLPPSALRSLSSVLLALPVAVFALLGWGLFTLQPVARTLTIFLHGLSIIVRLLVTLARVVPSRQEGTPADVPLFVSSVLSIVLSTAILYYVDKPDTQLLFEA
jgi:hypothetical protein